MRCHSVQQLYEEYAHGTLSTAALSRIEEHLAACETCRHEYELNDQVARLLRQETAVAHPGSDYFEDLTAGVLARLDQPGAGLLAPGLAEPRPAWRQPVWWSGLAAALALGVLGLTHEPPRAPLATHRVRSRLVASATPIAARPTTPTVVLSENKKSRVLVLDPLLLPGGLSSANMSAIAALTPDSTPLAFAPKAGSSQAAPADSPSVQTVAIKPAKPAASAAAQAPKTPALPPELAEQFDLIRRQMLTDGEAALGDSLRSLERQIDERSAGDQSIETLPLVRQVRLFVQAEEALRTARPRDAWTLYTRILMVDATTPLALRANLQLADLAYNEWADFREAGKYYRNCQADGADRVFSPTERDHIARQLDRLRSHKADNWETLGLQHLAQHGDWPEALSALRRLLTMPGADDLLPETARSLVDRMQAASPPAPMQTAIDIYKLLDAHAAAESNASVRAWLELALGDMQLVQFQELQGAIDHYKMAIQADGDSAAARLAATKRDQLIDRQLQELVR